MRRRPLSAGLRFAAPPCGHSPPLFAAAANLAWPTCVYKELGCLAVKSNTRIPKALGFNRRVIDERVLNASITQAAVLHRVNIAMEHPNALRSQEVISLSLAHDWRHCIKHGSRLPVLRERDVCSLEKSCNGKPRRNRKLLPRRIHVDSQLLVSRDAHLIDCATPFDVATSYLRIFG